MFSFCLYHCQGGRAQGARQNTLLRRCHGADRENDKSLQYFSSLTIWNAADFVSGSKNCHIFSELLREAGTGEDSVIYI